MLVNARRLERKLSEIGADAIVGATFENVQYLTGVCSVSLKVHPYFGQCFAVAAAGDVARARLVSSVGEVDQILDAFEGIEVAATFGTFFREMRDDRPVELTAAERRLEAASVTLSPSKTPAAAVAAALQGMGLSGGLIAIDHVGFKPGVAEEIARLLPKARFVNASHILAEARRVKTPEEIRRIRRAAGATEHAIQTVCAMLQEGVTEREAMREFNCAIAGQGATPQLSLIRFGRNGVGGQVTPDLTRLVKGDTIWFDVACVRDGYWSDIARNVSFGGPEARVEKYYAALKAGEDAAIALARPGMPANELFDIMVDAVRQAGIPHYRRHHVGHGIGSEIYEEPILRPGNDIVFEAGMVLNVETPYYEFGTGAIHVEDPFVVGENGDNTVLTSLTRDLIVIEP